MVTQVVTSDIFRRHDNIGHPENAERTLVMYQAVQQSPIVDYLSFIEPELYPEEPLYQIHSERMIERIKEISASQSSWLDLDTYVCKHDFETARYAIGGTVQLIRNIYDGEATNGFALVRPPGHHATSKTSMGFCLFNNIALAAQELVNKGKKVLIFDLDVHHGNGTQDIFYASNKVLYQSFHLSPHFPGTGAVQEIGIEEGKGYTVNVPLSFGHGNTAVETLMKEIFLPIATQFNPDFILVSSGFDSHYADPLGGMHLTVDMFGWLLEQLLTIQSRLVCTLEGGYNLSVIGPCLISQLSVLSGHPLFYKDMVAEQDGWKPIVKTIKNKMKKYWDI